MHPEEKITRAEALKMHTIWAAYFQFEEKDKGSLEIAKLADMVVIDRDYLTCAEDSIKDIEPVMRFIGGKADAIVKEPERGRRAARTAASPYQMPR
jgi:predicted amidohydrolase YtcJ